MDFKFLFFALTNVSKVNEFCEIFYVAKSAYYARDAIEKVNGFPCFISCQLSTSQFPNGL